MSYPGRVYIFKNDLNNRKSSCKENLKINVKIHERNRGTKKFNNQRFCHG